MSQKYRIIAKAPIGAQLNTLRKFGAPQQFDKSLYMFNKVFKTEAEAIQYLRERAETYIPNERELSEAISDIEMYGSLTLDLVTAQIEKTKNIY